MLTLTSHYALRAMIYLAQHEEDWPITGGKIAEQGEIPAKYLSKILGDLVRAGILESSRGKSGGFWFAAPTRKTKLVDVLTPFEQFDRRKCPFGNQLCNEDDPCLAHEQWKRVVDTRRRFLERTSVFDIAVEKKGRKAKPLRKPRKKRA